MRNARTVVSMCAFVVFVLAVTVGGTLAQKTTYSSKGSILVSSTAQTATAGIPVYVHAPYLVNIASPNPDFLQRSRALAGATARACDELAIDVLSRN